MPYNQKSDIWSLGCILYEMVTLRHAFDANSMKGLVLKILRGSYPAIPSHYSQNLKDLIAEMLIKDPNKRPSIRKILEKDFLSARISQLLSNTIAKHEFSNTFLKKHVQYSKDDEETGGLTNESRQSRMSRKQKTALGDEIKEVDETEVKNQRHPLKIKKDQMRQKRPTDDDEKSDNGLDTSVGKEKTPVLKGKPSPDTPEVEQNKKFKDYFKYKSKNNSISKPDEKKEISKHSFEDDMKPDDTDQDFEEEGDQRTIQKFLLDLPGVTAQDSQSYRIEALRVYLENELGDIPFIAAYKHLQNVSTNEDVTDSLEGIIEESKMKYITLIHQLIVCEDTYYLANE